MNTYSVSINYTNKALRSLAIKIGMVAIVGFIIWYIVDLPAKYLPRELSIPYYLDFLPRWLLYVFGASIGLAVLSYILSDIRKNKKGIIKIDTNSIIIESGKRCDMIHISDLKRITFIVLPFGSQPYRVEFIYPDFSFKRIKLKNKDQFDKILDNIHEIKPDDFEVSVSAFESLQK